MSRPTIVDDGGEDDDLRPPEIPDPGQDAQPLASNDSGPSDPRMRAFAQAFGGESFDDSIDAIKAADTPPEAEQPDVGELNVGGPPASFGDEIKSIVDADKPSDPQPPAERRPLGEDFEEKSAAAPTTDDEPVVPKSYAEFLQAIEGMKRADGRPYHPNAVAAMRRKANELGIDHGFDSAPGNVQADTDSRDAEAGFVQAEKARYTAQGNLLRLLTQLSIEAMRDATRLTDTLTRSRH